MNVIDSSGWVEYFVNGFNADFFEAACYAVMGEAALRSEPLPTVFNGTKAAMAYPVLGKIVQPPVKV